LLRIADRNAVKQWHVRGFPSANTNNALGEGPLTTKYGNMARTGHKSVSVFPSRALQKGLVSDYLMVSLTTDGVVVLSMAKCSIKRCAAISHVCWKATVKSL